MGKNKCRCNFEGCKKKLNLVQQTVGLCKCNKMFCPIHRLNHNCTYDYKGEIDEDKLIEKNKCVADKMTGGKI
jgi:hypothetical protein